MNRNAESRFATNPTNIDMSRSAFNRNQTIKTSFNVGDLIPFYVDEVLPGDTMTIETAKLARLQTLLSPMMDNLYLDTYYFFVPNRLCWEHWQEFCGENTKTKWYPTTEYSIPQITAPDGGWSVGTIADYLGVPTGISNLSVNALPFRAYSLICNEWFRDENLTDPLNIPINDSNVVGSNGGEYINDVAKGGKPFKAAKYHDYFTSALPAPQKGPSVTIGLTGSAVVGNGYGLALSDNSKDVAFHFNYNGGAFSSNSAHVGKLTGAAANGEGNSLNKDTIIGLATKEQLGDHPEYSGLTTLGNTLVSINELRQAFQIQKFYEQQARGGSRYIELLKAAFGVTSPDARLQRPEYLGGDRITLSIDTVIQSSSTQGNSPLGNTAAYSVTSDIHSDFTRSFVEHGFIIGLAVARYDHTYQQGLEKMWSRKTKFDYYWPVFANLGEMAILNKEIYATGTDTDDQVFGYQEAWAEYRYKPSRVSGELRSQYAQSLDYWHLGDKYTSLPHLSDSWIREDKSNVDRVLAVTSSVANQIFMDIFVKNKSVRCMPVYSIPGLIDHH